MVLCDVYIIRACLVGKEGHVLLIFKKEKSEK